MFWNQTIPDSARTSKRTSTPPMETRTSAVAGASYKVMERPTRKKINYGIGERQIDQVLFHRVMWQGEVAPFDTRANAQAIVNRLNKQAQDLLK